MPENQNQFGETLLIWEAPEYANHEKSKRWYLIAAVAALSVIVYALITAQYTMAIVFALLAAVYHLVHNHPAKNIMVQITTLGMVIDGEFYQFSDIAAFWILYQPPVIKKLQIRIRKRFLPDLSLEIMDQDPQIIRQVLEQKVSEIVGRTEHFSDKLARWLQL